MAGNEIAMSYFSHDNHFLLAVSRTSPGLEQLWLYEASKGNAYMGAEGATGGKEDTKPEKEDNKNQKLKGRGEKTFRYKNNVKDPNKRNNGQKSVKKPGDTGKTVHGNDGTKNKENREN